MKLNENQIKEAFKSKGCSIKKIDDPRDKGYSDYGMTVCMNKEGSLHMFHSFNIAYGYFTKMNWI
jgi:hypothetical protein|tara:strand:- start:50 stop:244 length:195 start_codon:yes stop_codon:yes gene_type:complete